MGETTEEAGTVPERSRDPRVALYEAPRESEESTGETGEADKEPETGAPGRAEGAERAAGSAAAGKPADTDGADDADGVEDAEDAEDGAARSASGEDDRDAAAGPEESREEADGPEEAEAEARKEPAGTTTEPTEPTEPAEADQGETVEETGEAASDEDPDGSRGGKEPAADDRPADGRPSTAKPVDQTTAMLRVRPDRTGSADGESDVERTSRFVPLRSPDAPRPLTPTPSAPSAPTTASDGAAGSTGATPSPEAAAASEPPEAERTRQQPLPPHRPLELLAELTNKPAPPPTPLRTALRRLKIWSPLVALLVIAFVVVQLLRPLPEPELRLTAPATYSFGGEKPELAWPPEGQAVVEVEGLGSLGTYGEQKPVPIASVAKVMTAYVILRDHPMKAGEEGPLIPVDKQAEEEAALSAQGESTVEVEEGEEITLNEALHAVMIASANNVARLLARWDTGGSEEEFVKKMNATAEELGMTNTTYTDASGLRQDTVSTAADQVKLGKKVMDFEVFREIVKKPSYEDRNGHSHRNWNGLVPYNNAIGIKPGTTTAAGGNLLFAGEKEIGGTTQLIVGAVLGQHKPPIIDTVVHESRELLISTQEVLRTEKVVAKGDVVGYVDDGLGGRTQVVATEDVTAVGWSGLKVELALTDGGEGVPGTAEAGETVGTLTVGSGPGQVKVPVAVREEMTEPDVGTRLTRVL
nr:serine hydrolase [Streptomyces taklimakanensis]